MCTNRKLDRTKLKIIPVLARYNLRISFSSFDKNQNHLKDCWALHPELGVEPGNSHFKACPGDADSAGLGTISSTLQDTD